MERASKKLLKLDNGEKNCENFTDGGKAA